MPTIYLPNTPEVQDLLTAIEDIHTAGHITFRECIEVKVENAPLAAWLKSLNISSNGVAKTSDLTERTCKRCGKQFDPLRVNQYTCPKCLSNLGKARMAKNKNGQAPASVPLVADS